VVVVLVNFLVDCCQDVLMLVRLDDLVLNCRRHGLVNSSVVVSDLVGEVAEGCLGFVHFDIVVVGSVIGV